MREYRAINVFVCDDVISVFYRPGFYSLLISRSVMSADEPIGNGLIRLTVLNSPASSISFSFFFSKKSARLLLLLPLVLFAMVNCTTVIITNGRTVAALLLLLPVCHRFAFHTTGVVVWVPAGLVLLGIEITCDGCEWREDNPSTREEKCRLHCPPSSFVGHFKIYLYKHLLTQF